jgi:CubicO group peptidase (beta-lactamase class C family)
MSLDRSITLGNWMEPPYNRVAFGRVRELAPTALIANRTGRVSALASKALASLGSVMVDRLDGSRSTFDEQIETTWCDAVCVVHDGSIVYERYQNAMTDTTPHLVMSVSKSFCAAALGVAVSAGKVATTDLVTDIAPEFTGTSLDGATVQHVIDMTAGTDFVEDYDLYDDPNGDSPLIEFERQSGYRPLGAREPIGTLALFGTYGTAFEHGASFSYRSPLTNVAARVLELVHGERYPDVLSRDLWGPMGMEHAADIMLDPLGHPVAEGGISCTLRDLARLGLVYLDDGLIDGVQVLPPEWVADTRRGTDGSVALFAAGEYGATGWSTYRNGFWVFERDQIFGGLGIFGQYCLVHRPSRTVIARTSTYPSALPMEQSDETLAALITVCEALG